MCDFSYIIFATKYTSGRSSCRMRCCLCAFTALLQKATYFVVVRAVAEVEVDGADDARVEVAGDDVVTEVALDFTTGLGTGSPRSSYLKKYELIFTKVVPSETARTLILFYLFD